MSLPDMVPALSELARLYGIQPVYEDGFGRRRQSRPEIVLDVLKALGAPVTTIESLPEALRERRQSFWSRPVEPVIVAWQGQPLNIEIRIPASVQTPIMARLTLEKEGELRFELRPADLTNLSSSEFEGTAYQVKTFALPSLVPAGYHRLTLETGGKTYESLIISAPLCAYSFPDSDGAYDWGVFLPLYALRTKRTWGSGDYPALGELTEWVGGLGGRVIQSLPLLPVFTGEPILDPSPYLPVSRLLWNEFYVDFQGVPELGQCAAAREIIASGWFKDRARTLSQAGKVDYSGETELKRLVLQELTSCLFARGGGRLDELNRFAEARPAVVDYARFRAASEKMKSGWRGWPAAQRDGHLNDGDCDRDTFRLYLFSQWLAHEQLSAVARRAREKDMALYLDLPVGVHPDGFDTWRYRGLFVDGLKAGAPPDPGFTTGQDWLFPPLDPTRSREQGYAYFRDYIRHHLAHCNMLRIDHVMGLHRLFVIPRGLEPAQGVYLRYPADELYAILTLESQRNRAVIVGEDLGTVPPEVRPAMDKHNLQKMYVLHFELEASTGTLREPPHSAVASLNTHDMAPFEAFWNGLDIDRALCRGLIDKTQAQTQHEARNGLKNLLMKVLREHGIRDVHDAPSALRGCLSLLADSRARTVMVSLEDLWRETEPQNIPGTPTGCSNWQRKSRYGLEAFRDMPEVTGILGMVNEIRVRRRNGQAKRNDETN